MIVVVAIAIALAGGFLIGYAAKCHRARAEAFLAGRLFERRALRRLIDEAKAREGDVPDGVSRSYR